MPRWPSQKSVLLAYAEKQEGAMEGLAVWPASSPTGVASSAVQVDSLMDVSWNQ